MSDYQPSSPCSGELKDARVAPLDLPQMLATLARYADPDSPDFDTLSAARYLALMTEEAAAMPLAEDIECGFDGEVDDATYHRMADIVSWVCPRCSHENEEDAPGPDPDRAYDEMRDARDEGRL